MFSYLLPYLFERQSTLEDEPDVSREESRYLAVLIEFPFDFDALSGSKWPSFVFQQCLLSWAALRHSNTDAHQNEAIRRLQ
ncbi:hypothetical protein Q1695_006848 [Nippostrongylus brasiliensis]|nr:hypothetical protein Q1695_006848 [Nippostrongylus brasiliensis]